MAIFTRYNSNSTKSLKVFQTLLPMISSQSYHAFPQRKKDRIKKKSAVLGQGYSFSVIHSSLLKTQKQFNT